jgi:hypothetical protein
MAQAGLAWLAGMDAGSVPAVVQADCLRGLERAESMRVAACSSVLAAFSAGSGYEDDGHGSARTWLKWQARVTGGAAAGAVGWMRRLAAHRAVLDALAAGRVSVSWARCICDWTDQLPGALRGDADLILLAAVAAGAELADLAALAEEMRSRAAPPDADGADDGFDDRSVQLDLTFGGAGRLDGNLTPQCAAALAAVLESLGKKNGPDDRRTSSQRRHDALEEACRRLAGTRCLPDRAGQPTQIQLHMTLDQLRGPGSAPRAEAAWAAGRAAQPGWLDGPAAAGAACDATIIPVVYGHVDTALLSRLAAALQDQPAPARNTGPGADGNGAAAAAGRWRAERAARQIILAHAAELMSGPAGLAAYLRTGLPENLVASVSLPLDIGAATDTIPVHLRRAVTARDRKCRFPGCDQPPAACQPHHLIPRSRGGPTSLTNMLLLCSFHHLIAVHRWGWGITLHPDGTITATSPDGKRLLHSHSPPASAA